ncbi:hypothetical protein HMPREF0322_01377 [Desulfitobacterium hafniense DP7]|uniref:Uncharacterized protein n=1 Tax=Desulfitobacterium hafniense DP7 TaxID=537010 RepID=G9XK94_DESHA|nr:hypothetical protein HMPREF0322_01377 [Desulfitobacterium hafniense DP7]
MIVKPWDRVHLKIVNCFLDNPVVVLAAGLLVPNNLSKQKVVFL